MFPKGVQIPVAQREEGDVLKQHLMVAEEGMTLSVPGFSSGGKLCAQLLGRV